MLHWEMYICLLSPSAFFFRNLSPLFFLYSKRGRGDRIRGASYHAQFSPLVKLVRVVLIGRVEIFGYPSERENITAVIPSRTDVTST